MVGVAGVVAVGVAVGVAVVVVVGVGVAVAVGVAVYLNSSCPNNGRGANMRGIAYTADFYRAEVERLTLALTQSVSVEGRVQLQRELASAREHLTELKQA